MRFYTHVVTDIIVVGCLMWAIFYMISGCATPTVKEVWPVVIVCPEPERVLGPTNEAWWTTADDQQEEISKKRCIEKFGKGSCLKKIVKIAPLRYIVVCKKY